MSVENRKNLAGWDMRNSRTEYLLGDLGEIKTGKTPPARVTNAYNGMVPFVTPRDMDGRKWINGTERYLSKVGVESVKSCLVPDRSVAVSCIGSDMGKAAMLAQPSVTNQQINTILVDEGRFNAEYIYYDLSARQQELKGLTGGSATPILNKGHFSNIKVLLPSKPEQDAIASILGSLDDKISLNRAINKTLEQMAQAIFKSWFVDFDPVKAKIEAISSGDDPERAAMRAISGKSDAELDAMPAKQRKELAETAALFPDELVESELGMIPKGWGVGRLGDQLDLAYGRALSKADRQPGRVPVYGSGGRTGFHHEHLVHGPGIIVGRKGTIGTVYWEDRNFYAIDTVYYVIPKPSYPLHYLYRLLQTLGLADMNTDAAVPGLNRNNVYRLEVPQPTPDIMECFSMLAQRLSEAMTALNMQIDTLVDTRDTLLPKLLSGEISINE